MPTHSIDLNADVGEASTREHQKREEALLHFVSSVNIACGFHAGGPEQIDRMIRLAKRLNLGVGAHPSYPGRESFGRESVRLSVNEVESCLLYQLGALGELAARRGTRVSHVKPHGALYADACRNLQIARVFVRAVIQFDRACIVVGLPGSRLLEHARSRGLRVAPEAFADRVYERDGSLRSRKFKDALIVDPEKAAEQALRIVSGGFVKAIDGREVPITAKTICIHGDTPNAVEIAKRVKARLLQEGVKIQSFYSAS